MTDEVQVTLDQNTSLQSDRNDSSSTVVLEFKARMLMWRNPVEYVNNMYGSHPDDGAGDNDYFEAVFGS
jgi:hypothetical protein